MCRHDFDVAAKKPDDNCIAQLQKQSAIRSNSPSSNNFLLPEELELRKFSWLQRLLDDNSFQKNQVALL